MADNRLARQETLQGILQFFNHNAITQEAIRAIKETGEEWHETVYNEGQDQFDAVHQQGVKQVQAIVDKASTFEDYDKVNADLNELKSDIFELTYEYATIQSTDKVPLSIPNGSTFWIENADGGTLRVNTVDLFGSSGNRLDYWGVGEQYGTKRVVKNTAGNVTHVAVRANASMPYKITVVDNTKAIPAIEDELTVINNTVNSLEKTSVEISFDNPQDFYVNSSGVVGTSGSFKTTQPFELKKGQKITITASGYQDTVSILSSVNGNRYTCIVPSVSGKTEYVYTATQDITAVISYNADKTYMASATGNIVGRVESLEEKMDIISASSVDYMTMFKKIGIIGDSLSSGEIAYTDGSGNHYVDRYDSSWLSLICRPIGAECAHYSQGGMTTKTWLENVGSKKTMFENDTACNAYFVALGTNDASESYPMGNAGDSKSTASYAGYLKNIIELVHEKAPNSVIFVMSLYGNSEKGLQYSNTAKSISDLYSYCFYVDFRGNTDIYTGTGGVWSNLGHFTSIGYVKVAQTIKKLVNNIVDSNKDWFKFFTLNN